MRNYRNLPKPEQNSLRAKFPDLLKLASVEETLSYHYLAVSVFDHWLARDEFYKFLDNVPPEEQSRRNEVLYKFSKKIASETEILSFKFCGRWPNSTPKFREFTSEQYQLEYLSPALTKANEPFFNVVLPDLGIVLMESWDDTNVMYLRDISVRSQLELWAKECGVYILDKWT